ncbi:HNH endonuclease signature motif containing protein [Microbacterium aurantiacum]|uniref:HNH endonuclease signature motif containing protein n=1 Tax=Microbacterium aurantiacum TaxID=162393 RepID=UPI001FE3B08E|nr:HNH endonuclease signature motif containing protein [Microbacterium aurantiacum]
MLDATDSQMAMLADLVESMQAAEATLASMQAARDGILALAGRLAIDIAKQGDHPDKGDMTIRAVAAEIGQALRVSDRTVERRIGDASWLVDAFPAVWAAQGAGRISAGHARVIIDAGAHLTDEADRERYAAAVLPLAEAESPNRLRPLAKRIAERFQERSIDERHQAARAERRVWIADADDGMADLHMHAPAVLVHGMMDRLSQMAHQIKDENMRLARDAAAEGRELEADTRTVDEIRADLLADLVLTGVPTGHDTIDGILGEIRASIEITVPVMTLMAQDLRLGADATDTAASEETLDFTTDSGSTSGSLDDHTPPLLSTPLPPALLDGVIPIDAETARVLAVSTTGWNRVLTHPVTGAFLAVDRYRPSEHLKRHLKARDQRCRFPTCGIVARKCDADHNEPASAGGATCDTNLADFCRRHHMLKHHSPWQVAQLSDGLLEWRSPTGRSYIDRPPPQNTVVFAPNGASVEAAWATPASELSLAPF